MVTNDNDDIDEDTAVRGSCHLVFADAAAFDRHRLPWPMRGPGRARPRPAVVRLEVAGIHRAGPMTMRRSPRGALLVRPW